MGLEEGVVHNHEASRRSSSIYIIDGAALLGERRMVLYRFLPAAITRDIFLFLRVLPAASSSFGCLFILLWHDGAYFS